MIGISVVVHNNLDLTKKCIESIILNTLSPFRLIVTDNASTDGTAEYLEELRKRDERITTITNSRNLGFGRPHNVAVENFRGKSEYSAVAILNNDIVLPKGWDDRMLREFKDPEVAIVGVRGACSVLQENGTGDVGDALEYVEGSCMMVSSEFLRRYPLFSDEFFFAYYEDSDLSLRARALGWKLAAVDLQVSHVRAATRRILKDIDIEGIETRNQRVFLEKWGHYLKRRRFNRRILVVRHAALGDVLLTTGLLGYLHRELGFEIDVRTHSWKAFKGNPNIRQASHEPVAPDDEYDAVYDLDLAYEKTPKKHIVSAYAEALGIDGRNLNPSMNVPELYPSEEESMSMRWADELGKFAVIHGGPTSWVGRDWPQAYFQDIANHLKGEHWSVVVVGSQENMALNDVIDMRAQTTLHQLYALMKKASLFVGIDSSPMHVAVAAGIPTVGVFGCIDPKFRLPTHLQWVRGVTADPYEVGCLGCHHYLPAPRTSSDCFRGHPHCMTKLPAARVVQEIHAALHAYSFRRESR